LAALSELTLGKRKLYEHIQHKGSAFCKLKKKYEGKLWEMLCDVDSEPLMESLSSSFSVDAQNFGRNFWEQ
jgi:hypothetical protein